MSQETSPPLPSRIERNKLLLVEGKSPVNFFTAATRHLGISDTIQICNYGGITELRKYMAGLAVSSGFRDEARTIGVVRDAEGDAKGAKQAVADAFERSGVRKHARTECFILPDDTTPGNIETLCLRSVLESPLLACVDGFVTCTAAGGVVWAEGYQRDKARVQIFASTLESPQAYAGLAAYRGAWPWESPAFADLFAFLRRL